MAALIRFFLSLFMPVILIGGGGALVGWGLNNTWSIMIYAGLAMIAAGVLWGLVLWLWVSDGGL
ncbi:hypothetical protein [Cognatiyoonia sp. IB215182]|uniref:hypothetical protein n=1 Tax=Cognatiyoonia sp. IB215182 TaxID=3097353 RepID=UPI002A124FEB|nr:hypothetical protein [Cognatiyoonia sp. IB215182]MDX8351585.1 hypothetical protein [Cognatiyoonia sp. IB215182]